MKQIRLKNYFLIGNDLTKQILEETDEQKKENLRMLHIEPLQFWLAKLKLHGEASRARTRFNKILADRVKEIEEERIRLVEDNCKQKKGEPVYLDKDGKETTDKSKSKQYAMDKKQMAKFEGEYNSYLNEDLEIDITPERQDTIYGVRDLIMNTKEEFAGLMANRYGEWCDCFDAIKEVK